MPKTTVAYRDVATTPPFQLLRQYSVVTGVDWGGRISETPAVWQKQGEYVHRRSDATAAVAGRRWQQTRCTTFAVSIRVDDRRYVVWIAIQTTACCLFIDWSTWVTIFLIICRLIVAGSTAECLAVNCYALEIVFPIVYLSMPQFLHVLRWLRF